MNKAVFLDRDGVINVDRGYVHTVARFTFIPGVFRALKRLSDSHFKSVIITDQSGIGRGYYTKEDAGRVHQYMLKELSKRGARIDKIYYCPHAPEDRCSCRKPKTTLLRRAKREFHLDLSKSYFIGDKTKDIQTGKNAGCKTILVATGKGGKDLEFDIKPDFKAKNLEKAVERILNHDKQD